MRVFFEVNFHATAQFILNSHVEMQKQGVAQDRRQNSCKFDHITTIPTTLVVGVVWKVNGRPPTSTRHAAKTSGRIELKDEAGKVSNFQPLGGRLGDGVK